MALALRLAAKGRGTTSPNPMVGGPISVMRHEHDQHGVALRYMETLTDGIQKPRGACNTWRALYAGLEQLREDLMYHIHLENNILFADALGDCC